MFNIITAKKNNMITTRIYQYTSNTVSLDITVTKTGVHFLAHRVYP